MLTPAFCIFVDCTFPIRFDTTEGELFDGEAVRPHVVIVLERQLRVHEELNVLSPVDLVGNDVDNHWCT